MLNALRYHLELGKNEGVLVDSVEKDSPFAVAGLVKHDIITKVDGEVVDSKESLVHLLKDKDKVTIEIVRQGGRKNLDVNLHVGKETPEGDK